MMLHLVDAVVDAVRLSKLGRSCYTINREELASFSRKATPGASSSVTKAAEGEGYGRHSADENSSDQGSGGGSSSFRSGLLMEGDSAFGPLRQIEENGGDGVGMECERAADQQQVRFAVLCLCFFWLV